jgi:hypothetical protein
MNVLENFDGCHCGERPQGFIGLKSCRKKIPAIGIGPKEVESDIPHQSREDAVTACVFKIATVSIQQEE